MLLTHEYRLHTSTLVHLPAIPEWSDFDGRHGKNCIPLIWGAATFTERAPRLRPRDLANRTVRQDSRILCHASTHFPKE